MNYFIRKREDSAFEVRFEGEGLAMGFAMTRPELGEFIAVLAAAHSGERGSLFECPGCRWQSYADVPTKAGGPPLVSPECIRCGAGMRSVPDWTAHHRIAQRRRKQMRGPASSIDERGRLQPKGPRRAQGV